ncbi:MAG: methyltransferase domain-containing protein [Phycisphaerales bacterium]|nr:methyltransferase domain-containing protein [Phycisphaerales bacterium]
MQVNEEKMMALLGTMVGDMGAAMSAALVTLGDKLGLYRALATGPMTPEALAAQTGLAPRMVREWLLNQAAGGYVTYMGGAGDAYSMTPEQAAALADETSPFFVAGGFDVVASAHRDEPKVERAFRDGKGLPWGAHDTCLFCGTERFFAASYRGHLVSSWIPALEGVEAKLRKGAMVADVGCGHGASTVLMAAAYPQSKFTGFDSHGPSIDCAARRAKDAGLKNIAFRMADATSFAADGGFDLVACFDCLHDMADPVGCARHVKRALRPGGTWMVVEPAAGDTVESNLNPVGRVFSAASTMICVPASMSGGGPALGACAGEKRMSEVIKAGGFTTCRKATATPFNMVLEARA